MRFTIPVKSSPRLDSLNGRMWRDDSQMVSLHAEKRCAETARAEVEVKEVEL